MSAVIAGLFAGGIGAGLVLIVAGLQGRQVLPDLPDLSGWRQLRGRLVPAAGAVAAGSLVWLATGWPVGGLLAAGAAVAVPKLVGGRAARQAEIARTEAIAAFTESVRDTLQPGTAKIQGAINAATEVAPEAIADEVARLNRRIQHMPLEDALAAFGEDLDHPSADLVVAALTHAASGRRGRNHAEVLSRLADSIRGGAEMRRRVAVGRTQIRSGSKIIVGVFATAFAGMALGAQQFLAAYDTPAGQVVLAGVGTAFAAGGWLLHRMAAIDMPERFTARTTGDQR